MSRVLRVAVCEWCNSEFGLTDPRGRFCGRNCAARWRVVQPVYVAAFARRSAGSRRQAQRDRRNARIAAGLGDRETRFKSKLAPPNENGCRLWTAGCFDDGYGAFKTQDKLVRAHRYAWEIVNGQIPDGMLVCHKCDVPTCCEISHLWIGTNKDNMRDMVEKGRACSGDRNRAAHVPLRGELNARARLTEADIRFIRESVASGVCRKELAEKYDVGLPHICSIVVRRNWKHVS